MGGVDHGLGSSRFVRAGVCDGLEFPIRTSARPPPAGYRRVTRPLRFMARRSAAFSFLVAMLRRLSVCVDKLGVVIFRQPLDPVSHALNGGRHVAPAQPLFHRNLTK